VSDHAGTNRCGFASPNYDVTRARAAQRKGNQALRTSGRIYRWTAGNEKAREAGRKGGLARAARRRGEEPAARAPRASRYVRKGRTTDVFKKDNQVAEAGLATQEKSDGD
jgi:hypothetical protein